MKSRKPKAKTKQKTKRTLKQQRSTAAGQAQVVLAVVPPPVANAEPETVGAPQIEIQNVPTIPETSTEIEHPTSLPDLRDESAQAESLSEEPGKSEMPEAVKEALSEAQLHIPTDDAAPEIESSNTPFELPQVTEDAASTVELREQPEQTEDLESIIDLHVEVESAASPVELSDATGKAAANVATNADAKNSSPTSIYDGAEIPVIPVDTPPVPELPSARSSPRNPADRRAHPRYAFVAAIEVEAPELGVRIKTQVRDISQQGCFVDTDKPLSLGTTAEVRINKGATTFEARARVVYNQAAKGMGLMFTTVELGHLKTLDTWIAESRESSWRAANRRRSQRVLMKVPVKISGQAADGTKFEEETHTLSISPHGALLVLAPTVLRGQRFILANLQTKAALECVVAYLERIPGQPTQIGVEFSLPNPAFWRVAFPPKDWTPRHPDAKSR
jgi:hypothetical protein